MIQASEQQIQANFIDAPRDPDLQALYAYWQQQRGARAMPARADLDPAAFSRQLPHVMLYDVGGPGGPHMVRLVGSAIVQFVGRDFTGHPATAGMEAPAAAAMTWLLDTVVAGRVARFRLGKAWWWREKNYRDFEAAFMPLSADGTAVNMIFTGVKFHTGGEPG